nr:MAG TPA: protein of unknown function DUF3988 [Caudoviricetes sp.]
MITNVFIKLPRVGDAVVGEISTGKVKFITADSFNSEELSDNYERIGAVYNRRGRKVKIVYLKNELQPWATKWTLILSGYTLDGKSRTGVISFRADSSSADNTEVTVTYKATTAQELVDALNSAFTANSVLTAQHWKAYIDGANVKIEHDFTFWQQASFNSGKLGFSTTGVVMPNVEAVANIRRKHGGSGGEGALSSLERAIVFYRRSTGKNSYEGNVTSPISSTKDRDYPINLQSYLGENCAEIRKVFGEGEQGWLKCLLSYMPVKPTDYGNMGMRNGLERTKLLLPYNESGGVPIGAAAEYCYNISTTGLPKGRWYMPTIEDLSDLMSVIKYGSNSSVASDPINKTIKAMGGIPISNNYNCWSCCRYNSTAAWYANGACGFFSLGNMYFRYQAIPVSLCIIED